MDDETLYNLNIKKTLEILESCGEKGISEAELEKRVMGTTTYKDLHDKEKLDMIALWVATISTLEMHFLSTGYLFLLNPDRDTPDTEKHRWYLTPMYYKIRKKFDNLDSLFNFILEKSLIKKGLVI